MSGSGAYKNITDPAALLDPSLVELQLTAVTDEAVIRYLGGRLESQGLVTPAFIDAVVDRERNHPTGLPLMGDIHVAIPHADVEHVLRPALAVATLAKSVNFRSMADANTTIPVSIVILMALTDPDAQVEMLRQLALLFQDSERLREVYDATSEDKLIAALSSASTSIA